MVAHYCLGCGVPTVTTEGLPTKRGVSPRFETRIQPDCDLSVTATCLFCNGRYLSVTPLNDFEVEAAHGRYNWKQKVNTGQW
jgi:hypothetical protein